MSLLVAEIFYPDTVLADGQQPKQRTARVLKEEKQNSTESAAEVTEETRTEEEVTEATRTDEEATETDEEVTEATRTDEGTTLLTGLEKEFEELTTQGVTETNVDDEGTHDDPSQKALGERKSRQLTPPGQRYCDGQDKLGCFQVRPYIKEGTRYILTLRQ